MELNIDVYLTTKKDELPDLRTYTTEDQFYKWKNDVKFVAFHSSCHNQISDELLEEASKYRILEVFALIEYPTGKVLEADEEIGEKFREFFREKHISFNWSLTRDEAAQPDQYTVSLEVIVEKG
jgi:glucose-6-phosphate 1-dehydrogenase